MLQTGHLGPVQSVAFSPNSTLLASSSDDGTVKLWDVASRRELRSLVAPDTLPSTVAFSRDGQWVTASGYRFRAWSVATGKSTDADARPNWKTGSSNGQWRAGETDAGTLLSQDTAAGGATHEIPRALAGTELMPAFSPDDRWLLIQEESQGVASNAISGLSTVRAYAAADSVDATIRVWEVGTWRAIATIAGRRPVNADPVFSPDGKWLAVIADGRQQIELWNVEQGKRARVLDTPMRVSELAFSPDSNLLLAGAGSYMAFIRSLEAEKGLSRKDAADPDASILLWDIAINAAPRTIKAGADLQSVAFSADGHNLAVAGDHGVAYWDTRDALTPPVVIDAAKASTVAFSPDGQRIAWAVGDGIRMRDLAPGAGTLSMTSPVMPVGAAWLSPDGHWLAAANRENFDSDISGRVRLWDIATGREAHTLASDAEGLRTMVFSPDSRGLITFGNEITGWDASSGQALQPPSHPGPPPPFHLSSTDGRTMAFGPEASGRLFIQTPDSKDAHDIKADGPVDYMSLSPDGRWLTASGCNFSPGGTPTDCVMRLWDTTTRKKVRAWSENGFNLSVSPDGRRLVAAGGAGRPSLQVWDIASGAQELAIGTHLYGNAGVVNATAFSADSRLVAFSNDRHVIEIWDIEKKTQTASLAGHTNIVGHLSFMPDGRLLSTSFDGTIRLWNPASGELLLTMAFLEDQKQWLAVTPSGLFDGSPGAWTHILWRFQGNTFDVAPVDTFVNEFYYPGLIGEIFSGQQPAPPRDIAQIDRRQPAVRLTASQIDARMTRLRVTVDDAAVAGGPTGAKDVRLFRNGSLVKAWRGDVLGPGQRHMELDADVPITAGDNRFTAYVFNRDNVKSEDATLTLTGTGAPRKGTAYVITIGVNEYANTSFNLKFAVADATRFGEQFAAEQEKIGRFERVQIVPLLDTNATKANILHTLNRLAGVSDILLPSAGMDELPAADPEDGVFIFFAGHGVTEGDRFYLVPNDLGFTGPRESLDPSGLHAITTHSISDQELGLALESVDAAQLLLVIDACNSGQALEAAEKRQGPMNSKGLAQLAYDKGMYVLTAAQSYQSAMETARLGHGLLTYALIESGLAGREADVAPKDGIIFMREWLDFAAAKVPTLELDLIEDSRSAKLATAPAASGPDLPNVQRPRVFYRRELDLQPLVIARR